MVNHIEESGPNTTYDKVRRIERYGQFWIVGEVTTQMNGIAQTTFELLMPKSPIAPYDPTNHNPDWIYSDNGLPDELLQPKDYDGMTFDVTRSRGVIQVMPSEATPSASTMGADLLFQRVNGPGFVSICNAALVLENDTGRTPTREAISRILADDSGLIARPDPEQDPLVPNEFWRKATIDKRRIHPKLEKDHPQQQSTFEGFSRVTFKPLSGMGTCGNTIDFTNCTRYAQHSDGRRRDGVNDEYANLCQRHTDGALLAAAIVKGQFPKTKIRFDGMPTLKPASDAVKKSKRVDRVLVVRDSTI